MGGEETPEPRRPAGPEPEAEPLPKKGSLDNVSARKWYLNQEEKIPDQLNKNGSLENQARQAHKIRNEIRTMARDIRSDRETAEKITRENPNLTWEEIYTKTEKKGYTGNDIYRKIIQSSQRSRSSVNQKLGL